MKETLLSPVVEQLVQQGLINAPDSAKGRLLRTAAHLFAELGYERTTVRELAKELGIQSGSLFYHYPNKEAILLAVMVETIHINTARMKLALAQADTLEERVLALIRCEIESIIWETGEAMSLLVSEWRSLPEQHHATVLQLRNEYEQLWLTSLREAEAEGKLSIDANIMRQFLRGATSWVKVWYDPNGSIDLDCLCQMATTLVLKP